MFKRMRLRMQTFFLYLFALFLLMFVLFVIGLMIGYGISGKHIFLYIFNPALWSHIASFLK